MKLVVSLVALGGVVSAGAMSPVHPSSAPEPSYTPAPGVKDPISCVMKDYLNSICDWDEKAIESGYRCCQWSDQCGDVAKCTQSRCCEKKSSETTVKPTTITRTVSPTTSTVTYTTTEDNTPITSTATVTVTESVETTTVVPEPHVPVDAIRCGLTIDIEYFDNYVCDATAPEEFVVNYPLLCCAEKTGHNDCPDDMPMCSEDACCVPKQSLPLHVMDCEQKNDSEEWENHKETDKWGYKDIVCEEDFEIRDDGFLCCRYTGDDGEDVRPECYQFGVFQACSLDTCCVPTEEMKEFY